MAHSATHMFTETEWSEDLGPLDRLEYRLLRHFYPGGPNRFAGDPYQDSEKLEVLLGADALRDLKGKVVVDFGCGEGREAIGLVRRGAAQVIGVDSRESCIATAARNAEAAGMRYRCLFTTDPSDVEADAIVSLDSFEHFEDPAGILEVMHGLLRPGGTVVTSFGPTWYHPYGGHSLSAFPWAHLFLTEKALLRWRADIRDDGATRFGEISGGLNQTSIANFKRSVAQSPFKIQSLELVPIRKVRWFHNRLTQEFTTSVVRCTLQKPGTWTPVGDDMTAGEDTDARLQAAITAGTEVVKPRVQIPVRRIDPVESSARG